MKIIFISISILIITGCGFKVVNQSKLNDYNLANITTFGDNRIAYKLKNIISSYSSVTSENIVDLKFKITKQKSIKEKNDKNQVTKYQVSINIQTTINKIDDSRTIEFFTSNNGEYSVSSKNSQTLINEKKLISLLTENIANEIAEEMSKKINDI
tara:strand:- start:2447 stop:2911 length:465 start_codon:yes stop_codon:yes gene_type:complete